MEYAAPIVLVIGLVIAVFWLCQFVSLMLLSESDFPGRHDKILWAAAFMLVFPVAPFAFIGWKTAYRSMRQWKTAYRSMRQEERTEGPE